MEIYPIDTKYDWLLRDLPSGKKQKTMDYILVFKDRAYATSGRVLLRIPCRDIPDGLYEWNALGLILSEAKPHDYHTKYDDVIDAVRANHVEIVGSDNVGLGIACYLTSQGITLHWMRHDGDLIRRLVKTAYALRIHSGGSSSVLLTASDLEIAIMAVDETVWSYTNIEG